VVGSGAMVVVVVGCGTDRTSAADVAGVGRSTRTAPEAMTSAAIRTAKPRTAQENRPPPMADEDTGQARRRRRGRGDGDASTSSKRSGRGSTVSPAGIACDGGSSPYLTSRAW